MVWYQDNGVRNLSIGAMVCLPMGACRRYAVPGRITKVLTRLEPISAANTVLDSESTKNQTHAGPTVATVWCNPSEGVRRNVRGRQLMAFNF